MEEIRGLLAAGVLPEILRRLLGARRSGVLHLAFGSERADFELLDGFLTNAVTTLPGSRLGDFLVQIGFLSERDRDVCLEIAALSGERIGESLLRHGLIEPENLAQGLSLQLREVIARTLVWTGGVYTFTDQAPGDKGVRAALRIDPRDVLFDAAWTLVSDPAIDALLGELNQRVRRTAGERLPQIDIRLSPADAFLLSRIDGAITAKDLLQLSPLPIDEAKASLAGLLCAGAVEYVDVSGPISATTEVGRFEVARLGARINSPDPYEVLGVSPNLEMGEVRWAYLRLLRACDPGSSKDPEMKPVLRHMTNQIGDAFKAIERRQRVAHAPSVPSGPAAAPAPPARAAVPRPTPPLAQPAGPDRPGTVTSPARPSALASKDKAPQPTSILLPPVAPASVAPADPTRAIDASAEALAGGRHHEALSILHEAIPRLDGRTRRQAQVQKARVLMGVEHGAKLAEEELKAVLAEDPGQVQAHALLGDVYHAGGSDTLAIKEYRKALELDPRNVAAREAMQQLQPRPQPPPPDGKASSGSVLKRFFKR